MDSSLPSYDAETTALLLDRVDELFRRRSQIDEEGEQSMGNFETRPLDATTWSDFARLVEKHNGVWGGCWCMAFHPEGIGRHKTAEQNRSEKESRASKGEAHAALVYDGPNVVGWCQFGPTAELPRIKSKRAYDRGVTELPDWRITCFFVDKEHRNEGVASAALMAALEEISRLGGGVVESFPDDLGGRSTSAGFLHNGTISMFLRAGFERGRRIGKNRWVVTKVVRKSM